MQTALAVLIFLAPPIVTVWLFLRNRNANNAIAVVNGGTPSATDNRFWTLFWNAFQLRCPVCKRGDIFPGWFKTVDRCPECGIELAKESGYYIGSIYFNYGLTGAIEVAAYVLGRFAIGLPDVVLLPPLAAFAVIFPLFFFRYARASWLVFDQYFQPRLPPEEGAASTDLEYAGDHQ